MNDPVLQDIKDRLNIADVIAGYIPIKKAGANFKALCPFHNEKSPSLQISVQKQIWHCFGCGEGGDVFGFVMRYENLEFKDALKILADKAGVKPPTFRPQSLEQENEKDLLLRINDFAARYYHQILMKDSRGKEALEYLKNRGLNQGTIERWEIGFAPDDFHALEKALASKNVNVNDLVKAGVSAKNERGQMYDRFRGRVTFPIYNYFGEIVGFSARILADDGKSAKYVNSPETSIYQKSKILFGMNFAKEAIRKNDEAVIVEGQMDCIAAHQADFTNTVASSGTALTQEQLTQLGRLTKNLKFCFDADTAGQTAARRAGELALGLGFKIKLIELKAVKDPDELIKKSPGLWAKAVSEAVWFLDHYINLAKENYPAGTVEQKLYLSKEVVPFLGNIIDPLEQDHYIHKLVNEFSISEKVIREQIKPAKSPAGAGHLGGSASGGKQNQSSQSNPALGNLLLQKQVLGALLSVEDFVKQFGSQINPEDFEDAAIKQLVLEALETGGLSGAIQQSAVAKEAVFMVESELEDMEGNQLALLRELTKAFARLKILGLKNRQLALQTEIKQAETAKNKQKVLELQTQFAQVAADNLKFEQLL